MACPFSIAFSEQTESKDGMGNGSNGGKERIVEACGGSAVPSTETRLGLQQLSEAVQCVLRPSVSMFSLALEETINQRDQNVWQVIRDKINAVSKGDMGLDLLGMVLPLTSQLLGVPEPDLEIGIGERFFALCLERHKRALSSLGSTLQDLLGTLDGLGGANSLVPPPMSFRCWETGGCPPALVIEARVQGPGAPHFLNGLFRQMALSLFGFIVQVEVEDDKLAATSGIWRYKVTHGDNNTDRSLLTTPADLSNICSDLYMRPRNLSRLLPWHFVFDRQMTIVQMGEGFHQMLRSELGLQKSFELWELFRLVTPALGECHFQDIEQSTNSPFTITFQPQVLDDARDGLRMHGPTCGFIFPTPLNGCTSENAFFS